MIFVIDGLKFDTDNMELISDKIEWHHIMLTNREFYGPFYERRWII